MADGKLILKRNVEICDGYCLLYMSTANAQNIDRSLKKKNVSQALVKGESKDCAIIPVLRKLQDLESEACSKVRVLCMY